MGVCLSTLRRYEAFVAQQASAAPSRERLSGNRLLIEECNKAGVDSSYSVFRTYEIVVCKPDSSKQ